MGPPWKPGVDEVPKTLAKMPSFLSMRPGGTAWDPGTLTGSHGTKLDLDSSTPYRAQNTHINQQEVIKTGHKRQG